jgi:hypothetical protein
MISSGKSSPIRYDTPRIRGRSGSSAGRGANAILVSRAVHSLSVVLNPFGGRSICALTIDAGIAPTGRPHPPQQPAVQPSACPVRRSPTRITPIAWPNAAAKERNSGSAASFQQCCLSRRRCPGSPCLCQRMLCIACLPRCRCRGTHDTRPLLHPVRRAALRRLAWVSLWALAWLPPLKRSLVHQAGSNKRTGLLVHYSPCIRHIQSAQAIINRR